MPFDDPRETCTNCNAVTTSIRLCRWCPDLASVCEVCGPLCRSCTEANATLESEARAVEMAREVCDIDGAEGGYWLSLPFEWLKEVRVHLGHMRVASQEVGR